MSDDPVKLFVVVMGVLLLVLGFVALRSYDQAADYERAVQQADADAKRLRQYAAEVSGLCDQLKAGITNQGGYLTAIERAARFNNITLSQYNAVRDQPIGARGKERRFRVQVTRSRQSAPITREQIAKFCQTVERNTRGILKTIELTMRRATGKGGSGKAGTEDEVLNDVYTVTIIFGLRVIKS